MKIPPGSWVQPMSVPMDPVGHEGETITTAEPRQVGQSYIRRCEGSTDQPVVQIIGHRGRFPADSFVIVGHQEPTYLIHHAHDPYPFE
ncbi:MAG: hypothetical protein V1489_02045 [Candidatus Liptonbacteria bacterium]